MERYRGYVYMLGIVLAALLCACSSASSGSSDLSGSTVLSSKTTEYRYSDGATGTVYRIVFEDDRQWEYLVRTSSDTASVVVYSGVYAVSGNTITFTVTSAENIPRFTATKDGDTISAGSPLQPGDYVKL